MTNYMEEARGKDDLPRLAKLYLNDSLEVEDWLCNVFASLRKSEKV